MPSSDLVSALLKPGAYPKAPSKIELIQTHISWLFLTDSRVYKVKRPVNLGFLDFSTLERRKHFVHEELRLNRRLSPDMYKAVLPIVRTERGTLVIGDPDSVESGAGEVVDWALEMERLPAEQMLSERLERGEIDNQDINDLAQLLSQFHAGAATGPGVDSFGSPAALVRLTEQNFEQLRDFVTQPDRAGLLSVRLHRFLERRAHAFLASHRDLIQARIRSGRIREGHGDLHADNICFSHGAIQIYDCIEFSSAFRCSDVACDLAFLAMDLDFRGFVGFGRYLVRSYGELAGDSQLPQLITFYKAYRAVVRAKVACLTSVASGIDAQQRLQSEREAQRYLHLAAAYDLPPALILMCGLPASGKSSIARHVALPLHAAVLQSDLRRKLLAGRRLDSRAQDEFESGLYAPETKRATYASLLKESEKILASGRSVIVDATFSKRSTRAPFLEAAARLDRPLYLLHITASEEQTRARLERRKTDERDLSDAGIEVYLQAKLAFEAPSELGPTQRVEIQSQDGDNPEAPTAALIERMLQRYGEDSSA